MDKKFIMTVAMDSAGKMNILFGDEIEIPSPSKQGDTVSFRLGGGLTLPIILNICLATSEHRRNAGYPLPPSTGIAYGGCMG